MTIHTIISEESLHNSNTNPTTIAVPVLERSKSDTVISEDIDRFLPTEVSSMESDDDGDDDLLDEITEQEVEENKAKGNNEEDKNNAADDEITSSSSSAAAPVTNSTNNFRGRPSSCVFVASLAASLSDDELCISVTESFKQYGQLARVKVLRDPANRPYAFVQYTNDKDAKRALKMAQGSVLNGRTLRCESARVNRTLFVTHNSSTPFKEVAEICENFGELEQLVPSKDQNQYARRYSYPAANGFSWFVQFAYRDDAIRAFANLRSDPNWDVDWVQNIDVPKYFNLLSKRKSKEGSINNNDDESDDDESDDDVDDDGGYNSGNERDLEDQERSNDHVVIDKKSIFIGQLDPSVTKEKLIDRFSAHGKIADINLISKATNVFSFIRFETEEAAAAALERENHAIFLNKTMHVQYKVIGGRYGKKHLRKQNPNYFVSNGRQRRFAGPQVNLAPPPINMYRRRSHENEPMLPFMPQPIPSNSDYEVNPYGSYMKAPFRRTSLPNEWSSTRSYTVKSESDNICGDGATDATSEISASAGQANSATTYNNSSAGSMSQTNNNSNNTKKKYFKRGPHNYNETPKPYYFQPYYYHPMHYPMSPMGPAHPSQGPGGNHPYMMVYPMPPPPPTGVDGAMLAPPLPIGQRGPGLQGSPPITQAQFIPSDSNEFVPGNKPYHLDY